MLTRTAKPGGIRRVFGCTQGAAACIPLAAALLFPAPSAAQESGPRAPDAGAILRDVQRDQPRERIPAPSEDRVEREEAAPAPEIPADAPRVPIGEIEFVGNTVLPASELAAIAAEYAGRDLAFAQMEELARVVTAAYRSAGYLARVYLPEQDLSGGVLTVRIDEARLGEVRMQEEPPGAESRLRPAFLRGFLEAGQDREEPLSLDRVRRGSLLLNDLPGVGARAVLAPSEEPGRTDLLGVVEALPLVTGSLAYDNFGAKSTGESRGTAALALESPFGVGSRLQFSGLYTEGNRYGRASWEVPVGTNGLRLGVSGSYLHYKLVDEFEALDAKGDAITAAGDLRYPLVRRAAGNLYLEGSGGWKRYDNEQQGETTSQKEVLYGRGGLRADLADDFLGGGVTYAGVGATFGNLDLSGDADYEAQDAATNDTAGGYGVFTGDLQRLQRILPEVLPRTSLLVFGDGQVATKNLDSSESYYIGGPNSVRAYPPQEISGDDGFSASAELRQGLFDGVSVKLFYDYGWVYQRSTKVESSNTYDLQGWGAGADLVLPWDLRVSGTAAHPIGDNPVADPVTGDNTDGSDDGWRFWVAVRKVF